MELLQCMLYLTVLGLVGFVAGRLLPYEWLMENDFPFRTFAWEREGRIYEKLGIRSWHKKVPDMSRLLPRMMPAKRLQGCSEAALSTMIKETCVAEEIHVLLGLAALHCLRIWHGWGGRIIVLLYWLGNLPYILIQRYHRPRLQRLLRRMQKRKASVQTDAEERGKFCADTDIKLQYGGRA